MLAALAAAKCETNEVAKWQGSPVLAIRVLTMPIREPVEVYSPKEVVNMEGRNKITQLANPSEDDESPVQHIPVFCQADF